MINLAEKKKYKDGSADYVFTYDEDFIKYYKKETGRTKIDDKEIGDFITKMITELVDEGELIKSKLSNKPRATRKK